MPTARAKISALRRRLDGTLFRESPPASPAAQRMPELLVIAGLFVFAILLQMLRVGWSASLHSLWAEDGAVYLSGAVHNGFGGSLFDTYATYLVFVPRGIAELADLLPLADAPAAISILSGGVVALSGLVVWWATAGLIENPYLRGALAALTVLSPVGGLESTDSAAYVPWYMLFASFWVLLWRPRTSGGAAFAGIFALATGLSTPGVWFFIPMALLRTLAARDRRDAILLAGYWIGAFIQVPVLMFNEEEAVSPLWTSDIWTAYLQRVLDGAAFGFRVGGEAWIHLGWAFLVALLVAAIAALVWGAMRSNFGARLLALVAIPISVAMFVVSAYQRAVGSDLMWQAHDAAESAGRYAIVPSLLLVSVAFVMLDRRSRRRQGEGRPGWLSIGAVALAAVAIAASFYVGDTEVRGAPPWEAALDAGAETCSADQTNDSGGNDGGAEAAVPTSPPGWGLSVPCNQLP